MKKTLLAAAAILAVGCLASQAQVYSQNIVGYYNVTLTGGQYAMISGQLLNSDGSNSVNKVIGSSLTSGVAEILFWNGAGFSYYTYYNAADASPGPAGFYDSLGNLSTNSLAPGQGAFLINDVTTNQTVVGTVPQGTFTNYVTTGFNIYSANVPVSTNIDAALVNIPATSGFDQLLTWNGSSYSYYTYYDAADADPSPAGWYDSLGNDWSTTPSLWPTVGQAFFINHVGGNLVWTNTATF